MCKWLTRFVSEIIVTGHITGIIVTHHTQTDRSTPWRLSLRGSATERVVSKWDISDSWITNGPRHGLRVHCFDNDHFGSKPSPGRLWSQTHRLRCRPIQVLQYTVGRRSSNRWGGRDHKGRRNKEPTLDIYKNRVGERCLVINVTKRILPGTSIIKGSTSS